MKILIKSILVICLIVVAMVLPMYLWKTISPTSYENFLLKSVSPLTQKSRNEILRQKTN